MLKCSHAQGKIIEWLKKVKKEDALERLFSLELDQLQDRGEEILREIRLKPSSLRRLVLYGKKQIHFSSSSCGPFFLAYCVTCNKLSDCLDCKKEHSRRMERHNFYLCMERRKNAEGGLVEALSWSYHCDECKIEEDCSHLTLRFRLVTRLLFLQLNPVNTGSIDNSISNEDGVIDGSKNNGIAFAPNGLVNMGNTCFFNSTLQALASLVHLQNIPIEEPVDTFVSSFLDTMQRINHRGGGNASAFKPSRFFANLSDQYRQYRAYRQEDAQEVLARILDIMDNRMKDSEFSIVNRLFTGKLLSTIQCKRCEHVCEKHF